MILFYGTHCHSMEPPSMTPYDYPTTSEAQVLLLDVLARAAAQGWQVGRDPGSDASDCPYSQFVAPLKGAWFQGFNTGRVDEWQARS